MSLSSPAIAAPPAAPLEASYVLPIKAALSQSRALSGYLARLSRMVDDVIVVDGSAPEVFRQHAQAWGPYVRHVAPRYITPNGKVGGVVTGVEDATHERVIVADDDTRYTRDQLARMMALLDTHEVVRPQNFFRPLPWHARWDTARSLLARLGGGDWPGTLGVRRSALLAAGGYRGDVMFENLEMVRTIEAGGGRQVVALDLVVERRPPSARHFLSQRVRQAYDEFARPAVLAGELALLPLAVAVARRSGWVGLAGLALAGIAAAEAGRRKSGGQKTFPPSSALWAPLWLGERAVTSWLALGAKARGGVKYGGRRLQAAATPGRSLAKRSVRPAVAHAEGERKGPADRSTGPSSVDKGARA